MILDKKLYYVNWNRLATWQIPHWLRKQNTMLLVYVFIKPINRLHNTFLNYKTSVNYRLLITPQVCHLERALNDRYDFALRRIRIEDGVEFNAFPVSLRAEAKPVKLFWRAEAKPAPVLYLKTETGNFTADFIIKIPADVAFDINELRAFTDTYKLLSKKYNVQTF